MSVRRKRRMVPEETPKIEILESDLLQEIKDLEASLGRMVSAQDIFEFARDNPDSILHSKFEWDKDIAAYRYWIDRARQILRIKYKMSIEETTVISVAFVPAVDKDGSIGGYRDIRTVTQSNDKHLQIDAELPPIAALVNRYRTLAKLWKVEEYAQTQLVQLICAGSD